MKFFSLLIPGILLLPNFLPAQDSVKTTVKHTFEIGINPASSVSTNLHSIKKICITDYIPGVFLNYHLNKNILRTSFDYYKSAIHMNNADPMYFYKNDGRANEFAASAGYERRFGKKSVNFPAFMDASFMYYTANGISSACGCFSCYSDLPYSIIRKSYVISLGSGINYRIAKHLNLVYEFSLQQGVSYEKNIRAENIITWKNRQYRPWFNPLRTLGASYLF